MDSHLRVLDRMETEYTKSEGQYTDVKRFCFASMISEFPLNLTDSQINEMLRLLTTTQIQIVSDQLDDKYSWY